MELKHSDRIDAPAFEVYTLVKDKLPEIAKYLPNVEKIEKLSNKTLGSGKTEIINHWYAQVELPTLVKKFLSKELLSWKDKAVWDDTKMCVSYELESFIANNLFEAKGTNYFKACETGKSELLVTCSVQIHAENIPGVPKLMVRSVLPLIEKVIEKMLQPNLTSLGQGLKAFLADNPRG